MRKGVTGINLSFYAVMAFIFAILGQLLLGGLLIAFAILAEKDEWLVKQTVAAFILSITASFLSTILNAFNLIAWVPLLGGAVGKLIDGLSALVSLVVIIISLISITRVKDGKDADVPFASKFAEWLYNQK
jgi:hypothetical protein